MTREQARREIDSLDFYLQNHTDDYGEESHTAMMMAKDALSSSEKPNKWIPVSMTLAELNNKCHSKTHAGSILYVFDSETGADNWILDHSDNCALKNDEWELICVMCSDFVSDYSLKKELCDAEVECFYAIDSDKLVVVIEKDWNNDK